ncbi:uncharacterized protein [Lepidochelys kempii]|uniref:uncharacterized protein isoform X2 n=1 Tax=Lepidochelys kempii TaxID=8472 RepID=UPI003C6F3FB5
MGRLDDHAKKRIVELRKAGLSFRKIKKVLELDNIRVTPQAVYLFLKRKNVEPAQPPGASHLQPAGGRGSRRTAINQAGWEDEQLWNLLQENETEQNKQAEPRGSRQPGPRPPALPGRATMSCKEPHLNDNQDCKDSIKIISVTSLCKDSEQFGKVPAVPMGPSPVAQLSPINSDDCSGIRTSAVGSHPAPLPPAMVQQQLNSRGRMFLPPARNPALIVKKKIVDRAIHLQKKATIHNGHSPSDSTTVLPFLVGVQPASQPPRANPSVMAASMSHSAHDRTQVKGWRINGPLPNHAALGTLTTTGQLRTPSRKCQKLGEVQIPAQPVSMSLVRGKETKALRGQRERSPPLPQIMQSSFPHLGKSQGSAHPQCNG